VDKHNKRVGLRGNVETPDSNLHPGGGMTGHLLVGHGFGSPDFPSHERKIGSAAVKSAHSRNSTIESVFEMYCRAMTLKSAFP